MKRQDALKKMIPPGNKRSRKRLGGVIQIWVTSECEGNCFGCTQACNLKADRGFITTDQFEIACLTLKNYFGTVGVFGGSPTLHPQFETLCEILRKHIPRNRRGLWASHPHGKGEACRRTFSPQASNLNAHLNKKAFDEFKRDWPECNPFGLNQDSRHSPPYVAIQDLIDDADKRWELISNCDINQHWSAMICVFRGELRAYFCEIAGAQAMLHQHESDYPDLGFPLTEKSLNWWKRPIKDFASQVDYHCHACGIPLRGFGELARSKDGTEQTTKTHKAIFLTKDPSREVEVVTILEDVMPQALNKMTDYLGNAK